MTSPTQEELVEFVLIQEEALPETLWWHQLRNELYSVLRGLAQAERVIRVRQRVQQNAPMVPCSPLVSYCNSAPGTLLTILAASDEHNPMGLFSEAERFISVLFHPLLDILPKNSDLVQKVEYVISCLNERFMQDEEIRIPFGSWADVYNAWYRNAANIHCVAGDKSFSFALTLVNDFASRCQPQAEGWEVRSAGRNADLRHFMGWLVSDTVIQFPLSLRRLASFLQCSYVPERLMV